MNTSNAKFKDVDEYILCCTTDLQPVLKKLRATIKKAAPKADERISYGMPFYEYGGKGYEGRLIYFAVFKKHISLYITPRDSESVPGEMHKYHVSKATYQFPLYKPLPYTLIGKTVKLLVKSRDLLVTHPKPDKKIKTKIQNINKDILSYNSIQALTNRGICNLLLQEISNGLPNAENKVWHRHPVWFLDGNPIVGYSRQKAGIRLMFWSGASFDEQRLEVRGKKFKDASVFYNAVSDINTKDLKRWLKKSKEIQWDYKNIVKRKGILERLK
jgi:uncharacterized protein YdhG (YjbR/CyaY superfamily)